MLVNQVGSAPEEQSIYHSVGNAMQHEWLYYKIYVGPYRHHIDWLIAHLLQHVISHTETQRWFFVRYIDDGGLHLRLRLNVRRDQRHAVAQFVERATQKALEGLPTTVFEYYVPVVRLKPIVPRKLRVHFPARFVQAIYVAEAEKFGATGVVIAEDVFHASSVVAMRVLINEANGGCSRKTLVPLLMRQVVDTLPPEEGAVLFWKNYTSHWLAWHPASIAALRRVVETKWLELKARGVEVLISRSVLPGDTADLLSMWDRSLCAAKRAFARSPDGLRCARASLPFNFVHLMNNRLGVSHVEEAYFAGLLTCYEAEREA